MALPAVVGWFVLSLFSEPVEIDPGAGLGVGLLAGVLAYELVPAYVLQGIPEELIFRGWFFALTPHRPWFTFVWSTLAFSVIHLISSGGQ